jgi:uncharacterized protein (DUF302 family)
MVVHGGVNQINRFIFPSTPEAVKREELDLTVSNSWGVLLAANRMSDANNPYREKTIMKTILTITSMFLLIATSSWAATGLVVMKSPYPVEQTLDRLQTLVQERGMKVFERIDHAKGATTIGKTLRPTEVILFGNPQGGTPFMECAQTVGIDLPLKALAWEDATGQVWLGYNDPEFLAQRHEVPECAVVKNMTKALANIATSVTGP